MHERSIISMLANFTVFFKGYIQCILINPSLFLPLKLLSDLPQLVSLSTSYSFLFFLPT